MLLFNLKQIGELLIYPQTFERFGGVIYAGEFLKISTRDGCFNFKEENRPIEYKGFMILFKNLIVVSSFERTDVQNQVKMLCDGKV